MTSLKLRFRSLLNDEAGQVLPIVSILLVGLLGMAALTVDLGRSFYTYRALQATTDAAALAGARALVSAPSVLSITGAGGTITQYSAAAGGLNQRSSLPNVVLSSSLKCLNTLKALGQACVGPVPYNAVQVQQSTTIPLYIAGIFGKPTMPMTAISTASVRGGSARPSNVAVIMDTTLSMNTVDTNCNSLTQMQCALNGFQILLQKLSPCAIAQSVCAPAGVVTNSFDRVALFTFPNVSAATAGIDLSCTTNIPNPTPQNGYWNDPIVGNYMVPWSSSYATPLPWGGVPTANPYSFPIAGAGSYAASAAGSTYQLTGFLADYRPSDVSSLNNNSFLTKASGAVTGCGSMLPTNDDGVYGTYYAGALYAAQSALAAEHTLYPDAENVIIILSDGDATAGTQSNGTPGAANGPYPVFEAGVNASGNYPSYVGMCGQAVTAAHAAAAAGTLVYAVAYGSAPTGCKSDAYGGAYPNINPCDTMGNMASAPQYFYSDYNQSGSNSQCVASQPVTSLSGIFTAIGNDLTEARLIPNNTQ